MNRDINFDGKPRIDRSRSLTENEFDLSSIIKKDNIPVPKDIDERKERIDKLFTDLGRTLIKGTVVKDGLSKMNPAQDIPISQDNARAVIAAKRLNSKESREGTVITYSMFQNSVDEIFEENWNLRVKFLNVSTPASVYESHREVSSSKEGPGIKNLIKEFLEENGIAGTIISMLTLAPFQSVIFQTLTIEEAAKATQTLQVPAGIAILLELGIKVEQIIEFLNKAKIRPVLNERQIRALDSDPVAKAEALSNFGIDYNEMVESLRNSDNEAIIDYVNEYYSRYGGLVSIDSHLTIDHWIGYLDVARIQHTLRGAVNTADNYSQKFRDMRSGFSASTTEGDIVNDPATTSIHIDLASTLRQLDTYSNTAFDDIVNVFNSQLSDKLYCCLVEIFGYPGDGNLEILRTIAYILRVCAVDLSGHLVSISNIARRFIARKLQSAAFEIMSQLNTLYDKIQNKLIKAFTIDIPGLENCGGMLTLGQMLSFSLSTINKELNFLIRDMMAMLADYATVEPGSWNIAADRRELVGLARVLEVIAEKAELVKLCSKNREKINYQEVSNEIKDEATRNIITNIIENNNPSIQISDDNYNKFFANSEQKVSSRFNFPFGVQEIKDKLGNPETRCSELSEEETLSVAKSFWSNIKSNLAK